MDRKLPKSSKEVGRKYVSGKKKKEANQPSAYKQQGASHKFLNNQNLKVKTWPLLVRQS